jgi:hypothetical protein
MCAMSEPCSIRGVQRRDEPLSRDRGGSAGEVQNVRAVEGGPHEVAPLLWRDVKKACQFG